MDAEEQPRLKIAKPRDDQLREIKAILKRLCEKGYQPDARDTTWVVNIAGCPAGAFKVSTWGMRQTATIRLNWMAVALGHEKKGVGRAIVAHVIQTARDEDLETVKLSVRKTNSRAIRLYRSFGFEFVKNGDHGHERDMRLMLKRQES